MRPGAQPGVGAAPEDQELLHGPRDFISLPAPSLDLQAEGDTGDMRPGATPQQRWFTLKTPLFLSAACMVPHHASTPPTRLTRCASTATGLARRAPARSSDLLAPRPASPSAC